MVLLLVDWHDERIWRLSKERQVLRARHPTSLLLLLQFECRRAGSQVHKAGAVGEGQEAWRRRLLLSEELLSVVYWLAAHQFKTCACNLLLLHHAVTTYCNKLVHRCWWQHRWEHIDAHSLMVVEIRRKLLLRVIVEDLLRIRVVHRLHQVRRAAVALSFKLTLLVLILKILLLL